MLWTADIADLVRDNKKGLDYAERSDSYDTKGKIWIKGWGHVICYVLFKIYGRYV
jgi:hypothetical protein